MGPRGVGEYVVGIDVGSAVVGAYDGSGVGAGKGRAVVGEYSPVGIVETMETEGGIPGSIGICCGPSVGAYPRVGDELGSIDGTVVIVELLTGLEVVEPPTGLLVIGLLTGLTVVELPTGLIVTGPAPGGGVPGGGVI